jgi:hypothetical protein
MRGIILINMRFFILIITSLILLTGCGTPSQIDGMPYDQASADQISKKPRIPNTGDLKASVLDVDAKDPEVDDMEELLEKIDEELNRPNITKEDIERGWYYGSRHDMKYGTPGSWIWVGDSGESRWTSPNALEETDYFDARDLCTQTAGRYVISCLDTDIAGCEYVAKSWCYCSDGTKWYNEQGCILTDEEGEFVAISSDELRKGWYKGLPNQKKLNTPSSWIWIEGGQDSKWQNPSPR